MVALLRGVPRRARHLQPRAVAARAGAGVRRGARQDRHLAIGLEAGRRRSTPTERAFLIANGFHAPVRSHDSPVSALRRAARAARRAGRRSPTDDLRDLQVWHKLVWMDPDWLRRDPRLTALVQKGSRLHRGRQGGAARRRARAAAAASSRPIARPPRAGRSSSRPRPSITRSCRCCATPTSTCARIRTRALPRGLFRASGGRRASSCSARVRLPHARCSASAPRGVWPSEGSRVGRRPCG